MNGDNAHKETQFQKYIIDRLLEQGWHLGDTKNYDTENAIYPEDIESWIKNSGQQNKWDKLERLNGSKTLETIKDRLGKGLDKQGTMHVFRNGFSIAGCGLIEMTEAAPEDDRNQAVIDRYNANILRVVPELKYHPAREFAIDLVFFINGLPVATVELKTDFTQSTEAAMAQYREERLPYDKKTKRKEPLLTPQRGAIVHFAMSESEIMMATKLEGKNTVFLPFNKGRQDENGIVHAGNPSGEIKPDGSQEYPTAYFWEDICQYDAWLRIFHSFVYVEKKNVVDDQGKWQKKETLIFPRYHQLTAVNEMLADARKNGAGLTYLADHSAGSGKTSSISWVAHNLTKIRENNGDPVFNSVIIVTDRNVLDSQLQDAVKQIDHQSGVIAAIDKQKSQDSKSTQLSKALLAETPIIVVTIQTFPYAMEAIITHEKLKGKNYAVMIDEAHNSQTGPTAAKLQAALGMSGHGDMSNMTVDDFLERIQRYRSGPGNISYFAFTATPKHSTMMLFGRPKDPNYPLSDDNPPVVFHRYTMRQAIEENFILDVLKGYVAYETAFNLSKQVEDSKRVSGKAAKRALAQWMALHPTNVTQKVQFIIEHFTKNVAHRMDNKAKAMVVTSSRAAAIRYKKAFDRYIEQHSEYSFIQSLVAFSGKISGQEVKHQNDSEFQDDLFIVDDDAEFTEQNMNPEAKGQDLRFAFDRPEYRVMLVADKFQTGFDQPKLMAMYVDKKIANHVEIVQTFSRLNRIAPKKDEVFIIDFANKPENVKAAFKTYDQGAQTSEVQDVNVVYDIKERLDAHDIYDENDLANFKEARFKTILDMPNNGSPKHQALYAATAKPTETYNEKVKSLRDQIAHWESEFENAYAQGKKVAMKTAENHRDEFAAQVNTLLGFKSDLERFCRTYAYVAQLIDFGDPELENFAAFANLLHKRLLDEPQESVDLTGLVLTGFDIKGQSDDGEDSEETPTLQPVGPGCGEVVGDKPRFVNDIIERINNIFGETTPIQDKIAFVNHLKSKTSEDEVVMAQIENNTREQAMKGKLPGVVSKSVIDILSSHQELGEQVLKSDSQGMKALYDVIYDALKQGEDIPLKSEYFETNNDKN